MGSSKYCPFPEQFSGFRFAPQEVVDALHVENACGGARQPTPSRLTDVEPGFMMFGTGRHLWYVFLLMRPGLAWDVGDAFCADNFLCQVPVGFMRPWRVRWC